MNIRFTGEDVALPEKLENLPAAPGVYQHKDGSGKVLYVGKAKNLRNRVRQYFQKSRSLGPRIEQMLTKATDIEIIVTDSEVEALILEANLIKKFRPRYNVSLKDDKSYPYIVITGSRTRASSSPGRFAGTGPAISAPTPMSRTSAQRSNRSGTSS